MKCKVRMTYAIEFFVEGEDEDAIQDWLMCTTPAEAKELIDGYVDEEYTEEIICEVREDSDVDYVIGE